MNKITVVVLGDVGRSPRMQYHALSLSKLERTQVRLVGLRGEPCLQTVQASVSIRTMEDFKGISTTLPWIIRAPLRAVRNALVLLSLLLEEPNTQVFLVQNPPAIPTLLVVFLAAWYCGAVFVIDWHNLGFKMLDHDPIRQAGNPSRKRRMLSTIARIYEKYCALLADEHISVTKALSDWLMVNFLSSRASANNKPSVVYDRPHSDFRSISPEERIALLEKLRKDASLSTEICDDLLSHRAALVVSSTSWTEDEDFDMFLQALQEYSKETSRVPIVAVVTGKGPLKEMFAPKLEAMEASTRGRVRVCTLWLTQEDYPLFLAAADLGVCMHTSTSGLDLPMKVVDMFGAGLPTCAVDFNCLGELVTDGTNGRIFKTAQGLAECLDDLLRGWPNEAHELEKIRQSVKQEYRQRGWQENWTTCALPVFERAFETARTRRNKSTICVRSLIVSSILVLSACFAVLVSIHVMQ